MSETIAHSDLIGELISPVAKLLPVGINHLFDAILDFVPSYRKVSRMRYLCFGVVMVSVPDNLAPSSEGFSRKQDGV